VRVVCDRVVVLRAALCVVVRVALRAAASLARRVRRCGGRLGGGRSACVTVRQAAILQGFRPDYPWQGTRHQQFRQIGNAVPPPLAQRVLIEAMRRQA
jgi:site-specific DNA-cytosine methylase